MKFSTKIAQVAIGLMVVASTAASASAEWNWKRTWHDMHVGFHRSNAWPDPFNEADARDVMRPFEIMKTNGWRLHNTIGHDFFRGGDGALLASGQRRVHWIATQSPEARRTVYVLRGATQDETEARVSSVHNTLDQIVMDGPAPEVLITSVEATAVSGKWVDKINREWLEHLTAPQLPSSSSTGEQGVGTPTSGQ